MAKTITVSPPRILIPKPWRRPRRRFAPRKGYARKDGIFISAEGQGPQLRRRKEPWEKQQTPLMHLKSTTEKLLSSYQKSFRQQNSSGSYLRKINASISRRFMPIAKRRTHFNRSTASLRAGSTIMQRIREKRKERGIFLGRVSSLRSGTTLIR